MQEEGRPWIDLETGHYHRVAKGQAAPRNKQAATILLPDRLLAHMRRWSKKNRYLVEHHGAPGDPKKALNGMMRSVFGEDMPYVRHTFRHTCATWLLWNKQDRQHIANYLSMTVDMLEKVYGHPDSGGQMQIGKAFTSGQAGRRKKR